MTNFVCPNCKGSLKQTENMLVCENNHSFDKAKQGYVHLVKPNKIHSKSPGDSKEMIVARRNFLEKGYYDVFLDALLEIIKKYPAKNILDCGCGEGYYTEKIKELTNVTAYDISKIAVKMAASKYKGIDFAVASSFDIPVADNCFDMLINVFSPMVEDEFSRVLRENGILIYAVPGKRHLYELKEILYENPYENEEKDCDYNGFEFIERITVKSRINLENNFDIQNLFCMTPYYIKTDIKGCEKIKETTNLSTEIHFDFLVYQKPAKKG